MLGSDSYVEALSSPGVVQPKEKKSNEIKITRLIERDAWNTVVRQFTNEIELV